VGAPEARYIERDGAQLAYQVVGKGSADVLVVGETAQHFDLCWTDPYIHELFERGASFSRTVYMQPRGFGLPERIRARRTPSRPPLPRDDQAYRSRPRCTRRIAVTGSFTTASHVNVNRRHFAGRLVGHKLTPGRYEITATPTTNNHASADRTATFTIVG
jgi:hypothetical protein